MWLLLIIIGILLIVINIRALNKEKKDFESILMQKKTHTKDNELEILQLKNELQMTKISLEKEIKSLQKKIIDITNDKNLEKNRAYIEKIVDESVKEYSEEDGYKKEQKKVLSERELNRNNNIDSKINKNDNNGNSIKVLEMQELLKKGLTIDEVAEKLNIGKGEALLIKELYLK